MQEIPESAPVLQALDLQTRVDRAERLRAAKVGPEDLRRAATEFEAVFARQFVEMMFQGVEGDTLFGGGRAGKVFKDFLYDEYGKILAEQGALGVGDMVYEQMVEQYRRTASDEDWEAFQARSRALEDPRLRGADDDG